MVNEFNLKVLLIDKIDKKFKEKPEIEKILKHPNVTLTPFIRNYNQMKNYISKSKFIFIPNKFDASPRVATE